jgi:hypothetical protein
MNTKINSRVHKSILVLLVLVLVLVALPVSNVHAAGPDEPPAPPSDQSQVSDERIEQAWARLQGLYERQGALLERAESFTARIQDLIDRMNENGKDTSALQTALNDFEQELKNAHPINESAKGIINSHKGFDADGNVINREQAIETLRELGKKIKEVRQLVGEPGRALREAIRTYRDSHRQETTSPQG